MNSKLYPKSPKLDNYDFIKPSQEFRKITSAVIVSIFLFFLFYLILIAIAGAIMTFAVWTGVTLIAVKPGFLTLAAGGGIIALGIMVFIFLFKFIFSRTKNENPFRVEIKEVQHPELFAFIRELNSDTKTKFPKRIFLSPDVNAMVFYNSSFWSLFFPVGKNLEIGLGLVNSLTVSEFKSVLAHEFGHFSQRSMKLGSYIYTVNQVIYNLVYEYDNWDNTLSSWAQTGGIFGFFAGITFWIVERVRSLLKMAYNLINVNYMKLSREMEYHADLIAVSVSGNTAFKSALRNIELSSFAYGYTADFLNILANKERASTNLYKDHSYTLTYIAKQNKITIMDGRLAISDQDIENSVVSSRLNIKNQWASHPSLKERENNIAKVNIETEENRSSAWFLFSEVSDLQTEVTNNLYRVAFPHSTFQSLESGEYEQLVQTEINKYKISEDYNGFYENRYLAKFDLKELVHANSTFHFQQLYSKDNVEMIRRLESNKIDLNTLNQINSKEIALKYFEFDGQKYKQTQARTLIEMLSNEINKDQALVDELDKKSFVYNYHLAKKNNSERILVDFYQGYSQLVDALYSLDKINLQFQNFSSRLYSQPRWTEDGVRQLAVEFSAMEKQFKEFINKQRIEIILEQIESERQKEIIKEYITSDTYYSTISDFKEQSFINLSTIIQDVYSSFSIQYGNNLKELTDFQLELK